MTGWALMGSAEALAMDAIFAALIVRSLWRCCRWPTYDESIPKEDA